jgi:hypothetical protein
MMTGLELSLLLPKLMILDLQIFKGIGCYILICYLINIFSAAPSPSKPQQTIPQPPVEKDLFGFDEPTPTPAPAPAPAHPPLAQSPSKKFLALEEPLEVVPSPVLSRSTKHLPQLPEAETNFFGTPVASVRHASSQDLIGDNNLFSSEPIATPTPEPPKKPASALDSMMENSLFKVTHKPPPMIAKSTPSQPPAQPQAPQQQPAQPQPQPQPQQNKPAPKKFDWSSQNYRDIFAESEPTPTPATAPAPAPAAPQVCVSTYLPFSCYFLLSLPSPSFVI